MDPQQVDEFLKALAGCSVFEHMKIFSNIREFTFQRLSSEAETFAAQSKEIAEFVKTNIPY